VPVRISEFWRFLRLLWQRFNEDRCMQIASSLTFTTLLALVPLITVALTLISAFPVFAATMKQLQTFLLENLLPQSAHLVARYGEQFTANAAQLTAIGIGFLAVTAILMLQTIEYAFNQIWRVPRTRSTVQRFFIYWALLTIGPVLIGASLSLTSWLVSRSLGLVEDIPGAAVGLLRLVPVVLIWIALTLLYLAMPNRRVLIRDALAGGLLAALAFEAMKRGFAFYITQFPTYKLVYGAFASAPIFLLWVYLSWLVVLSGAVVVAILPEWRARSWQGESAPGTQFFDALHILGLLWIAHRGGEVLTLRQLHAAVKLRIDQIEWMLDTMSAAQWLGRSGPGWALIRDPREITIADVYRLFVFRGGPRVVERKTGREIDAYAQRLAMKVEDAMRISLEDFFSAAGDTEKVPPVEDDDPDQENAVPLRDAARS
jgi:membrane protein